MTNTNTTPRRRLYCRSCGERYLQPAHTFDGAPCPACDLRCLRCRAVAAIADERAREPLVAFRGVS